MLPSEGWAHCACAEGPDVVRSTWQATASSFWSSTGDIYDPNGSLSCKLWRARRVLVNGHRRNLSRAALEACERVWLIVSTLGPPKCHGWKQTCAKRSKRRAAKFVQVMLLAVSWQCVSQRFRPVFALARRHLVWQHLCWGEKHALFLSGGIRESLRKRGQSDRSKGSTFWVYFNRKFWKIWKRCSFAQIVVNFRFSHFCSKFWRFSDYSHEWKWFYLVWKSNFGNLGKFDNYCFRLRSEEKLSSVVFIFEVKLYSIP